MKTGDRVLVEGVEGGARNGTLLGCSMRHIVDFWIVGLDTPVFRDGEEWRAVVVPTGLITLL